MDPGFDVSPQSSLVNPLTPFTSSSEALEGEGRKRSVGKDL
jgi:hypothetical protein